MRSAAVIGGAGFIGSNLVDRLKQEGWKVIVIDKKEGVDMKSSRVKELFQAERPDIVFHLAGPIQLRYPNAESSFNVCVSLLEGTKNVLDAARSAGAQRLIFSSSGGAVYEHAKEIPTPEGYPASSSSLYGLMTLLLEKLIRDYQSSFSIPTTILRLSNVYGSGQWENVIRRFAESIKRDEPPTIAGDGSSTRDYVYIDDAIEAFWKAANSQASGTFNVGSSRETSLKEVFETIADALQWEGKARYDTTVQQAVSRNALDCTRAKKELGWEATTSFSEGSKKTLEAL